MRYRTISTECEKRFSNQGYSLSDGDRAFIDELTMIVLTENLEGDCTDEDIIQRIIPLGKLYFDPVPEERKPEVQHVPENEEDAAPSLWSSLVRFIFSWKPGSKD